MLGYHGAVEVSDEILGERPGFGFRDFCVISLASVAIVVQAAGAWFFASDLRTPLWGPDELAPLAFALPMVCAIYSFPPAVVAAGLTFKSSTATWVKYIGLVSLTFAVLLAVASIAAPAIILGRSDG